MQCVVCKRPIFKQPAAMLDSKSGPLYFGPVCARRARLTISETKVRLMAGTMRDAARRRPRDKSQLDLFTPPQDDLQGMTTPAN